MAERTSLDRLIDDIVRDARLTSERDRAELRRELESHFADAAAAADSPQEAIERFGNPGDVSRALESVYRAPRGLARVLRVATAFTLSAIVALLLQLGTNLQVMPSWSSVRIGGAFLFSAAFSGLIVVVLVTAWELDIEALCARLEREPVRLLLTVITIATAMMLVHALHDTLLSPSTAMRFSAVDVAIWVSTIAILVRTDRLFAGGFTRRSR